MTPFFSVVIPLYNKESYIEATLKSVLSQTFKDFEVVIVNDGSTDKSLEKVKKFTDGRIRVFSQENQGLSAARNSGIKNSTANYIAFIDADDLWTVDFLETCHRLIKKYTAYKTFATSYKTFTKPQYNDKNHLKRFDKNSTKIISKFPELTKYIMHISTLVVNKKVFLEVGYFDEGVNYAEDEDFYIRCLTNFDLIFYNQPKVYYRIGLKNQLTFPNKNFKRKLPDFNKYLNSKNEYELKPYLDFIHYKLLVLYKMEKNHELVKHYKSLIETKNLKPIQIIKYHLPTNLFHNLKKFYLSTKSFLT